MQYNLDRLRANYSALTSLEEWDQVPEVVWPQVPAALMGNTVLTELSLHGRDLSNEGATRLGEVLAGTCALRKLNILDGAPPVGAWDDSIRAAGAMKLGEGLACNSTLTTLHICGLKVDDEGAVKLAEGLTSNRSLQTLKLRRNDRLATAALHKLVEMLTVCQHHAEDLEVSELHGNENGRCSAKLVEPRGSTSLASLSITENYHFLGPEEVGLLAALLAGNASLTDLNLDHSGIGDDGAARLGEGLARNSTLTKLHLGYNEIGYQGVVKLVEGLASNRMLQTLHLQFQSIFRRLRNSNRLGTAAVDKLVEVLAVNTTLTDLDLSGLDGDDTGECATKLVEGGTSLASLGLRNSKLGPEGCKLLSASLAGNTSLTNLDLDVNGIGDTTTARHGWGRPSRATPSCCLCSYLRTASVMLVGKSWGRASQKMRR